MKKLFLISAACVAQVATLCGQTLNITAPGFSAVKLFDSTAGFTISGLGAAPGGDLYYLETDARFPAVSSTILYKRQANDGYANAAPLFNYGSPFFGTFVVINGGKIYFAESSTGSIRAINPDGTGLVTIGTVPGIYDLAFSGQNAFVSANPETDFTKPPRNEISRFDLTSGLTDRIVDTGGDYSGPIEFDAAGNLLYGATGVSAVRDLHAFSSAEVAAAFGPGELALAPPSHRLIANGKNVYLAFGRGNALWKDDFGVLTLHDLAARGDETIATSEQSLGHIDFAGTELFVNVTSFAAGGSAVYAVATIPEPSIFLLSFTAALIPAGCRLRARLKARTLFGNPPSVALVAPLCNRRVVALLCARAVVTAVYTGRVVAAIYDRRGQSCRKTVPLGPTLPERRESSCVPGFLRTSCLVLIGFVVAQGRLIGGPFDGPAGQPGSGAIARDDPRIVAWGSAVGKVERGLQDASDPELGEVTYGNPEAALGPADAQFDSYPVVSLGDGGWIEILFGAPITDRPGPDFAVFENGITDTFLELGFVEVSDDGIRFVRFPAVSLTPTTSQVDPFGALDATNLHNLAGKYRRGFGTPFDLAELSLVAPSLDILRITHVRIVDVVGSIHSQYATFDSAQPTPHIVNDPWPTAFETGGFDLDAIAVFHQIPEPGAGTLAGLASLGLVSGGGTRRPRKRELLLTAKRSSTRGRCVVCAFTMIEVVVMLTILTFLITFLLAGLNVARGHADAARCTGNLRQLAVANITYAADHDGQYVAAQEPTNTIRWHGVRRGVGESFDATRGPLAPYLGAERTVKLCPTLRHVLSGNATFEGGTGGYGYNAVYVGGTPADRYSAARISQLPRAGRTVMFTDAGFPRKRGLQEYAYCEPWEWVDVLGRMRGPLSPSVHFRHCGRANVAWCDGHVTAEPPTQYGNINPYGGDARHWKIGWFGPRTENGFWKP